MALIISFLFISLIISTLQSSLSVITQDEVIRIKSQAKTWTPMQISQNPFNGWTLDQLSVLASASTEPPPEDQIMKKAMKSQTSNSVSYIENDSLPKYFDWRDEKPECIGAIRNQRFCGCCWAFSVVEAFADRICINSNGVTKVVLSPQDLLSCAWTNIFPNATTTNRCTLGYSFIYAYDYVNKTGVRKNSCIPYFSFSGLEWFIPNCPSKCFPLFFQDNSYYYSKDIGVLYKAPLDSIKAAIMEGPVSARFLVYSDFVHYKSGIYTYTGGYYVGAHIIKIFGWGYSEDEEKEYYICQNSWGAKWGMDGFFYIETNTLGISEYIGWGVPDL